MTKRKKILSGIFALVIGLSMALPMRASADDYDHHNHHYNDHHWVRDHDRDRDDHYDHDRDRDAHYNEWRWRTENDHYRAYPNPAYAYRGRGIPANGQGMIDPRHPNLYWACDSDGHHCHWANR
jgi:Ni/Co efflux regulator RcnB